MKMGKLVSLLGAALVIVLALLFSGIWRASDTGSPGASSLELEEIFPRELTGCVVKNLPLGDTEYLAENARWKLEYDQMVYRSYQWGEVRLTLYAAYWRAGKRSPQAVAAHTPDKCWLLSGFICLESGYAARVQATEPFARGEWRRFADPMKNSHHVVFWHVVEGDLRDGGGAFSPNPPPVERVSRIIKDVMYGNPEQFFVRLVANRPLDEIESELASLNLNAILESLLK